jgi:UDP:flavonoid glycosyltransferase YjiC (YdhE family)
VLDEQSFGAAARALQAEIAAMPAPQEAARAVEEYVSRG